MIPNKDKGRIYPLKLEETQPIDATNLRKMLFEQPAERGVKLHWSPEDLELKGEGELYIRLLAQGYRDLEHWARKNGVKGHQAKNAYRRWRNRDTGFPRGETLDVLVRLSKTVCYPVSPVLEQYYPDYVDLVPLFPKEPKPKKPKKQPYKYRLKVRDSDKFQA